jgi:hypothetical protein
MVSTPLGTLIGGPLVSALGPSETLAASGIAAVALAIVASIVWTRAGPEPPTDPRTWEPGHVVNVAWGAEGRLMATFVLIHGAGR